MNKLGLFIIGFSLLFCGILEQGKSVENRLLEIEKQSHRKIRIFSKKQSFTQAEINSFLAYRISKSSKSAFLQIKEIKAQIDNKNIKLRMLTLSNEILPFVDLEAASLRVIPIYMVFSIEQKSGRYKLKISDFRIGKSVPSFKLAVLILRRLKSSTGFNFDTQVWEKIPFGIKKIKLKKGKIEVYY